jgi:hypothetical protein
VKDPTHFEALVNYGVVLLHDGAYLYAAQTFKSAIAVSPPAGVLYTYSHGCSEYCALGKGSDLQVGP